MKVTFTPASFITCLQAVTMSLNHTLAQHHDFSVWSKEKVIREAIEDFHVIVHSTVSIPFDPAKQIECLVNILWPVLEYAFKANPYDTRWLEEDGQWKN